MISDFYCAYNYHLGEHQRCWVHFLRDLKKLEEDNPLDQQIARWISKIKALYDRAKSYQSDQHRSRAKARVKFQEALDALGKQYNRSKLPQRVLAKRCVRFANEMFTFVTYPGMPSENNPAERAVRPLVIARKISRGTRSKHGSDTRMALASLFETCKLRKIDTMTACSRILKSQTV